MSWVKVLFVVQENRATKGGGGQIMLKVADESRAAELW